MGLVRDREPPVVYEDGLVWCPPQGWGYPALAPQAARP
jgi:hypothetical protein